MKPVKIALSLASVLLFVFALAISTALANAGALDPTFDTDGKVTGDFINTDDEVRDTAIQPDGKIIAAGKTFVSGNNYNMSLFRYNTDGSLDGTFSLDGRISIPLSDGEDGALAVAIQPNGKILVAGYCEINGVVKDGLARLNSDGTFDNSFGTNGSGKICGPWITHLSGLALLPDGKFLASGNIFDGSPFGFSVYGFNTDGSIDATYGDDGIVSVPFFGGQNSANDLVLQPGGKIIVAGSAGRSASDFDIALARLLPDGTLDTSFSGDGMITTDFAGGDDGAQAVALNPDGRIYVAGNVYTDSVAYDMAFARYLSDGTPDSSFGDNGLVDLHLSALQSVEIALDLAIQPADGKIVAAGYAPLGGIFNFAVVRLSTGGALDPTFGAGGVTQTSFSSGTSIAYSVALQSDGKVVAGGAAFITTANDYDFALARYLADDPPTPTATSTATATSSLTPTPDPNATPTVCAIEYTDVPQGSTFYSFVHCLACRNIIGGYATGCETGSPCFRPNNNLTRGQLAKIVSNAANFNEDHTNSTFEDVAVGSTFHLFIERLSSRSIINGYACGGPAEPCGTENKPYFRPNANVTRGQTSKIVAIARSLPTPPPGQQTFEDVATTSTFWQWIEALSTAGAIGGYPCGSQSEPCVAPVNRPYFRPANNVTRGQSSKIISIAFFPGCAPGK